MRGDPGAIALGWRRYRRAPGGLLGLALLLSLYGVALLAPFLAPYAAERGDDRLTSLPPQPVHLLRDGRPAWPYLDDLRTTRDPETEEIVFHPDPSRRYPVRLFETGDPYRFFGLTLRRHLLVSEGPFHLLGTDRRGRDLLSRILVGSRISLSVGLLGVFVSVLLGALLGGLSGYFGGAVDLVSQRVTELITSFPSIPLWMALAAALPERLPPLAVYAGIVAILSLIGWGSIARQVRGKVLAVKSADYVLAARAAGAGPFYLVRRHLLPAAYGHLIVTATLAVPSMILGETALSFLGLGIRPPLISWGLLLAESQHVTVMLRSPWLLLAAVPVVVTVVAFNLSGDALREAVDPYR